MTQRVDGDHCVTDVHRRSIVSQFKLICLNLGLYHNDSYNELLWLSWQILTC